MLENALDYFPLTLKSLTCPSNGKRIAKDKGVHREVESEGSWKQSSNPRNTNIIRRILTG